MPHWFPEMQAIRDVFEMEAGPPAAFVPLQNHMLSAVSSPAPKRTSGLWEAKAADLRKAAEYIPTAGQGTQPGTANAPHRIVQGQAVYSARFSPDGKRFLIGADDLAAHAFDSETGEKIMMASMLGRKDLLFDPSRNMFLEGHVSEISAIRFLPPNGDLLLSADYFGSISAWDAVPDDNGVGFERSRLLSEYSFSEFAVSDAGDYVIAGVQRPRIPEENWKMPNSSIKEFCGGRQISSSRPLRSLVRNSQTGIRILQSRR